MVVAPDLPRPPTPTTGEGMGDAFLSPLELTSNRGKKTPKNFRLRRKMPPAAPAAGEEIPLASLAGRSGTHLRTHPPVTPEAPSPPRAPIVQAS